MIWKTILSLWGADGFSGAFAIKLPGGGIEKWQKKSENLKSPTFTMEIKGYPLNATLPNIYIYTLTYPPSRKNKALLRAYVPMGFS